MVLKKLSLISTLGVGAVLCAAQASAANVTINGSSETLTFGGEVNGASINTFFDGGTDSHNDAGGAVNNVGITFSTPAVFQNSGFNGTGFSGGTGKFENVPSGATGVLLESLASPATAAVLDDANGFGGISFNYSLLGNALNGAPAPETVSFFSGLDGTGNLVGSVTLSPSATPTACTGARDEFCSWSSASDPSLTGTAQSAVFSTNARAFAEFDAITLNNAAPVPLPAPVWMLLGGIGGLAGFARRQRKA